VSKIYLRRIGATSDEPVSEANPFPVEVVGDGEDVCIGFEQVTVANSSIGFSGAQLAKSPDFAEATLETAQIRFRADGTAPSSTVGTPVDIGTTVKVTGGRDLAQIRFIRTGGTSGVLNVGYFKRLVGGN